MKHILPLLSLIALLFLVHSTAEAQEFGEYFTDSTLRLDYIFSGNQDKQMIAVDEMCRFDGWYGKRKRLSEVPMEGNGQIVVKDKRGEVIYLNSFSTLFQEWLTYDEAKTRNRAFENVFLVPFPKDTVSITVNLYNNRREVTTSTTHQVVPSDILIRQIARDADGKSSTTPYVTLQKPSDEQNCIKIAFVAEGYQQGEMQTFISDCNTAIEALFQHDPFKSRRDAFKIVAVESPSVDSGTSEPNNGQWLNTALHSNFDTFYSDRYLTTLHLKDLHNVLAGIPYEHIIVLVNTEKYGGGGILNSYNLSMTHHPKFRPVVVHEFGHSFAGLADEYFYESEPLEMYPHDVEPWEQNITTKVDFASKWQDMTGTDKKIGLYEGAGYSAKGVYRACYDCRMRTNENPEFCPVCQRAISRVIDFYTK